MFDIVMYFVMFILAMIGAYQMGEWMVRAFIWMKYGHYMKKVWIFDDEEDYSL